MLHLLFFAEVMVVSVAVAVAVVVVVVAVVVVVVVAVVVVTVELAVGTRFVGTVKLTAVLDGSGASTAAIWCC